MALVIGERDGLPLDRLLLAAWRQARALRHLVTAAKVLRDIIGDHFAAAIGEFDDLDFRRAAPAAPDRSAMQPDRVAPTLTQETRST